MTNIWDVTHQVFLVDLAFTDTFLIEGGHMIYTKVGSVYRPERKYSHPYYISIIKQGYFRPRLHASKVIP